MIVVATKATITVKLDLTTDIGCAITLTWSQRYVVVDAGFPLSVFVIFRLIV
jgi:hypothetical protein